MRMAENQTGTMQTKLRSLEKDAFAAKNMLKDVSMDASQSEAVRLRADEMKRALDGVYKAAMIADKEIDNIGFLPGQTEAVVTKAKLMQHEIEVLTRDLKEANRE